MEKPIKLGIVIILALFILPVAYSFSCSTPSGIGEIYQSEPPSDSGTYDFYWGTPDRTYDGANRINFEGLVMYDSGIDPSCTYVTAYWLLYNPVDFYDRLGGFNFNIDASNFQVEGTLDVPGTYRYSGQVIPKGTGCTEPYCITNLREFQINSPPLPNYPRIDTISPSGGQVFASGTTSVNVSCGGECSDPNGCDVFILDNEGDQLLYTSVNNCSSINCWNVGPVTYSGLNDGQSYTVECKVVDSYTQEDSYSVSFNINGTSCPNVVDKWLPPTPINGMTYTSGKVFFYNKPVSNPVISADYEIYLCSDTTNTCTPQLYDTLGSRTLDGSDIVYSFYIQPNKYYRWYVKYTNIPGCPDIGPRSRVGEGISWWSSYPVVVPVINLSSPSNQSTISDTSPDFIFTTSAATSTTINKLYVNGILKRTQNQTTGANSFINVDLGGSGNFEWYIESNDGTHTSQSEVWNFEVIQGPQITLISPDNGYSFPDGTNNVNLQWRVTSSTATIDRLYVDGSLVNTFAPTTNLNRNYNYPVTSGNYNWYVNSTDQNGISVLSSSRSFNVNCTSIWTLSEGSCQPNNKKLVTWVDTNNCGNSVPGNLSPVNGSYTDCFYTSCNWVCQQYDECQPENIRPCLSVEDASPYPCNESVPATGDFDETCQYAAEGDVIGFTSYELVDIDDPFNKGILPDMFNGIVAFFSTPFLYWILWISVTLVIFLSAVAILTWIKANT